MSQPTPPPYGPQPGQPEFGYRQPGQPSPYHRGPAPYQPPRPPKKPMNGWAIAGFTILGMIVSLILLGAVLAAVDGASTSASKTPTGVAAAPETAKADAKPDEKTATPSAKPPVKKETPPKPKVVEYPDGDYVVGEDIPAGRYETSGAKKGLFEFCSVTSEPVDDSRMPVLKTANADERIIVTLTKADGVVTVSGCEPLKARR